MINTVKANDLVIWEDVISGKQCVSKVLDVLKCESSYDGELLNRYCYRVVDVLDYLCEPKLIFDYNIKEVYKRSDSDACKTKKKTKKKKC